MKKWILLTKFHPPSGKVQLGFGVIWLLYYLDPSHSMSALKAVQNQVPRSFTSMISFEQTMLGNVGTAGWSAIM